MIFFIFILNFIFVLISLNLKFQTHFIFHFITFFNYFKGFSLPNKKHIVYGTGFPAGYVLSTIKEGAQFCVNVAHFAFAFTIAFYVLDLL